MIFGLAGGSPWHATESPPRAAVIGSSHIAVVANRWGNLGLFEAMTREIAALL
ncbi:hypothetical protein [Lysobacter sp. Root916]|uniref:hypothetical protein n=1 Tax=Lysobacter sp. Root916 TaxID=1736606 RepID=UPI000AF7BC9C|nr:hypothetical protein [Lysobacter sp. Root916]